MSNDLASTIQCKIITPINSAHHTRIDDATFIQNQRAHFAIGDGGVPSPEQVDQLGGNNKNKYYTVFNNKRITTNARNKKQAVEDIVKKLFKLQNGNSVKFRLMENSRSQNSRSQNYIVHKNKVSKGSKKYKYRVDLLG